jgi:Glycosyltransferase family 87
MRKAWAWWWAIPLMIRVAICVWFVMLLGVSLRVLLSRPGSQSVLPIYLAAAQRWQHGEQLYPPITGYDLYRNPPAVAAWLVPLSWCPPKVAGLLWRFLLTGLYAWGLHRVGRVVLKQAKQSQVGWYWLLGGVLMLPSINNGQLNLLITAGVMLGAAAVLENRWWTAAAWLAFAGYLKVYPLAVGLLAVAAFPFKLSHRLFLMLVLVAGSAFVLQTPAFVWQSHTDYVDELRRDDRTVGEVLLDRAPRDWSILPRTLLHWPMPRSVTLTVALTTALLFAVLLWKHRSGIAALQLGLIWMVLFGPATEHNTYSTLAPVCALQVLLLPGRSRWVVGCAWIATVLFVASFVRATVGDDLPFDLIEAQPIGAFFLLTSVLGAACEPRTKPEANVVEVVCFQPERLSPKAQGYALGSPGQ